MSGQRTILIIDDSVSDGHLAEVLLKDEGFKVIVQTGPHGAATVVDRHNPDLILVDVSMPRMTGDHVVEFLRKYGKKQTPVLLYSDLPGETLEDLSSECGANGWVHKGDALDELVPTVRRALGEE